MPTRCVGGANGGKWERGEDELEGVLVAMVTMSTRKPSMFWLRSQATVLWVLPLALFLLSPPGMDVLVPL